MLAALLVSVTMVSRSYAQPLGLQANSGRDCAVCHLNWVESFKQPAAVLLMDDPGYGVVAEADTCLGCHDGSVGDSRRRVWVEHGHRTGIRPPATMKVPDQLPLDDGRISCRTCHTAHSGQGPETLATTVFVRVRNDASQLCIACHQDKTKGPELGTHPVGGMPFPVPAELIAAGAHQGPDAGRLICQTCHTPHGSREHDLLVMGTQSSQLCLTCHAKVRPGFWRPDAGREHPQNPPLSSDAMRQAIRDMGTATGPGETLICLSCHKLHHGQAGRYMLADTLHESNLCLRCHPGRKEMFGSLHDLRVSVPNELNRLGQTPEQSGPCGACHTFHQFARRPEPQPLDPTGLCATCHQQERCAGHKSGLPFSHPTEVSIPAGNNPLKLQLYGPRDGSAPPSFACLTCHNPHETGRAHFLRGEPTAVCATCHAEKVAGLGPQHDFTDRPELTNAKGRTAAQAGSCGFCHSLHDAKGPALWAATKSTPRMPNGWCTECHSPTGMAAFVNLPALRHPSGPHATLRALTAKAGQGAHPVQTATAPHDRGPDHDRPLLPLFDAQGKPAADGFVTCASCHDPHFGSGGNRHLLRGVQDAPRAGPCAQCHRQTDSIGLSLHRPELMPAHFDEAEKCAPCHAAHERPGMPPNGTWAAPPGPAAHSPAVRLCTGCHSPGGGARPITPTVHPAVAMYSLGEPGTPGFLPLFDEHGRPGRTGQIACGTCHLPHGPEPDSALKSVGEPTSLSRLAALRLMVRPYAPPNLCSACHGFDGLRRYLYYHDPLRRRGLTQESQE
ncbi:MAG: hypothetical protein HRF43_08100 [Phycisphaerae bacterium]|jgi:predicted CXXCH cytochrome family protein